MLAAKGRRRWAGAVVSSPIAHSHATIQCAAEQEVLMLDGWHRSVGGTAEINFARGLGLPIAFREFIVKASMQKALA